MARFSWIFEPPDRGRKVFGFLGTISTHALHVPSLAARHTWRARERVGVVSVHRQQPVRTMDASG